MRISDWSSDVCSSDLRLAPGQVLEQLLEVLDVLRRDQVQQRHAFEVLARLVAAHLQVRAVGADVHALVHVGDRVAPGFDQGVAAALGFAHPRVPAAQRAADSGVAPFPADRGPHVLRLLPPGAVAGAAALGYGPPALHYSLSLPTP